MSLSTQALQIKPKTEASPLWSMRVIGLPRWPGGNFCQVSKHLLKTESSPLHPACLRLLSPLARETNTFCCAEDFLPSLFGYVLNSSPFLSHSKISFLKFYKVLKKIFILCIKSNSHALEKFRTLSYSNLIMNPLRIFLELNISIFVNT